MGLEIIGNIIDIRVIAVNKSIKKLSYLNKRYGKGRWRKLKGKAYVRFPNGVVQLSEVHWYEAQGIGKRDLKVKKPL